MYPRLNINLKKLHQNTKLLVDRTKNNGIDLMAVTKVFCGMPELAKTQINAGIKYLADSRVENLIRMNDLEAPKVLLRLPMISEVDEVVKYADISLNSELKTLSKLNDAAGKQNLIHKVILMLDLGDLREGILPKDIEEVVKQTKSMENIKIYGFGVNLTCYGGIIPSKDNLGELVEIAQKMDKKYNLDIEIISGGNSSSIFLIENGLPDKVNNLRLGEALVLGRETAYGHQIKGMNDDIFTLEAELIEIKRKNSVPKGKIGMDAFGNKPSFEDKGEILRGILAIGKQDVDPDGLTPYDQDIEILGASSDHLLLNLEDTNKEYSVGDKIEFKLDYGALLKLNTSEYVFKNIIE